MQKNYFTIFILLLIFSCGFFLISKNSFNLDLANFSAELIDNISDSESSENQEEVKLKFLSQDSYFFTSFYQKNNFSQSVKPLKDQFLKSPPTSPPNA